MYTTKDLSDTKEPSQPMISPFTYHKTTVIFLTTTKINTASGKGITPDTYQVIQYHSMGFVIPRVNCCS